MPFGINKGLCPYGDSLIPSLFLFALSNSGKVNKVVEPGRYQNDNMGWPVLIGTRQFACMPVSANSRKYCNIYNVVLYGWLKQQESYI